MQTSSDWSMTNVGQLTQKYRCPTQNARKSVYYTARFAPSRVGVGLDLAQNATNSRLGNRLVGIQLTRLSYKTRAQREPNARYFCYITLRVFTQHSRLCLALGENASYAPKRE